MTTATKQQVRLTDEQKQVNKEARAKAKREAQDLARIEAEKNQKPVKYIDINIEWRKSRIWGNNPFVDAYIAYQDGTGERATATCSGCGYDKESTVVAEIFNRFLRYKLWQLDAEAVRNSGIDREKKGQGLPYGIHWYDNKDRRTETWYFGGGIGMSCYPAIAEAIGGELTHVASGKTFDVYKYTDK